MKRFLAVYLGSPDTPHFKEWQALPAAERSRRERAGMEAWQRWADAHKAAIVDIGAPLGKTKRVDASGLSDTRNDMSAYVIIEAETHAAAAQLFKDHPHFSIFPGQSVEIMECLPMPAR